MAVLLCSADGCTTPAVGVVQPNTGAAGALANARCSILFCFFCPVFITALICFFRGTSGNRQGFAAMERVSPLVMADSSPGGAARAMRRVAAAVTIVAAVVAITMIVADGQPAQVRKRMACIVPRDRGVARHAARKIHTAYLETRGWRGGSAARRDCRTALDDRPPSKPLALRLTAGHRHQPCSLLLAHAYAVSLCVLAPCSDMSSRSPSQRLSP